MLAVAAARRWAPSSSSPRPTSRSATRTARATSSRKSRRKARPRSRKRRKSSSPRFSLRIALGLEYDGAAFCGWQTQPGACGGQDHLQQALARLADAPIEVTAAGRTDAGVHATAQVVHFDTEAVRDDSSWVRGTNSNLHESARVLWASPVPGDFHARYSARSRTY